MGDEQGQGSIRIASPFVLFLDENHCRNPHLISVLEERGVPFKRHVDHFAPGTEDIIWLPEIGQRGWALLTTDAKIRYNFLEREAVRQNAVRLLLHYQQHGRQGDGRCFVSQLARNPGTRRKPASTVYRIDQ